ncbi:sigma-70 family RNA polymerase sigma factor [Algoriphagus halophytocola]|uniref:Sigma-70 family RNA polymerase sigma factor n=1 Tax=Algoriphagus halophytocola TaxID=2991499 RepID=A0ABY6MK79_9BACT|nr:MULTISPECIES: sigma-70 family RNA polymerase sigma factor [unclassified Algoriphagus]UZD23914.1 sigma-70 family RNA polymerase sigma factor [Algoriphagus sp. TR-M5]WBL41277.1 sigma-70 family RNA polymerase sigma factor [Algoriphagus sp. TR-M9]
MTEPTAKTIENFKKGKQEAIETIYYYYKPTIVRFIVSLIKDAEEAEVIFHNVFLKILRKKQDLDTEKGIRAYIFTISKNEVRDYFNQLSMRRKKAEEFYVNRIENTVDLKLEEEALLEKLEKAVEMLSEQRKKVIRLSYFENLSYQEIADQMLISKNTVKNHLIKARLSLGSYLR